MGWGGGLILSKAQKSAATPAYPLLASAGWTRAENPNTIWIACGNAFFAAEAVLQRYSPSGEFQALSNGVRIAHWSENHFAGTAGFLLYLLAKTTHMEQA